MLATLILTVTITLPDIAPRSATVEFQMPDLAECVRVGDSLWRASDETRRFWYVCRRAD